MKLELLGAGGRVTPADLVQLADLIREAESALRAKLPLVRPDLRASLATLVTSRWDAGKPGGRPAPPSVTEDHSKLVSAFHAIDALPFVPELTGWLNRIIPLADGAISQSVVQRKLTSLFAQALDDGADITTEAAGKTYDVRLWAVATAAPKVDPGSLLPHGAPGSTRFPGKQENRVYRYSDAAQSRSLATGKSLDGGAAYRANGKAVRLDLSLTGGVAGAKGRRQLAATALSTYQFQRIKEPLGRVDLPVVWVARVQDRATGRWKDFTFSAEDGTPREEHVPYAVAQFQLPFSDRDIENLAPGLRANIDPDYMVRRAVTTAQQFPLWDLDHAVSRVQLADTVLTKLRDILTPQDYLFWKPFIEAEITNDTLAMGLGDVLRPRSQQDFQQVFRVNLQGNGRHLSLSLTAGDQQPISSVTKISEVSRSGETRFDQILAIVQKTLLSRERGGAKRGTFTGALRFVNRILGVGGRGQHAQRHAVARIRHHRAWLTRAKRVVGRLQVVLADFSVQLDVVHQHDGQEPTRGSAQVEGYAHLMMAATDLRKLGLASRPAQLPAHQHEDDQEDTDAALAAQPDPQKRWWTPGSQFGITMDYLEKMGGIPELYNQIVPVMSARGYLPTEARGPAASTPWAHLQSLAATGEDLNKPGQAYANWLTLVAQASETAMRIRADDVMGMDSDEPGVTLAFPKPGAERDPKQRLAVGLRAQATTPGTHQGTHVYQLQYGHTSVDTMTVKHSKGHTNDLSGSFGADLLPVGPPVRGQAGAHRQTSAASKVGRTQNTALTSDTDGQKMPSARYRIDLQWDWTAEIDDTEIASGQARSNATVLQPDVLHVKPDDGALPGLNPQGPSALKTMGAAIYTAVGVTGLGRLTRSLITALPDASNIDIRQAMTPIVYKSALIRAMSAASTIPVADLEASLTVEPTGRPQITKVWFPYTQQVLESQVGREQGNESGELKGWNMQGGPRFEHLGAEHGISRSTGIGEAAAKLHTVGSYRGVYQDTRMAIVRTAVTNTVTLPNGEPVTAEGEVLINVLLSDVVAHHTDFDDPLGLLTEHLAAEPVQPSPPLARALTTTLDPPVSLQDGYSWAVVWPLLYGGGPTEAGYGALQQALTEAAQALGGAELAAQVTSVPSWLSPYMAKMRDGGAALMFGVEGRAFELVLQAQLLGPAREGRPGPTGEKIYERANDYGDKGRKAIQSSSESMTFFGAGGPILVTTTLADVHRGDQTAMRGSNLLSMAGLRANQLNDFTQAIRFSFQLREVTGLLTQVRDGARNILGSEAPTRAVDGTAQEDHVVSAPAEGTRPHGVPQPDFQFTLRNTVPTTHRIPGMFGLQAIYDAVRSTGKGRKLDPVSVAPSPGQLNFENMRGFLAAMLTHEGANLDSVATAAGVLDVGPGGLQVRARYGQVRDIYFMEKAELENYDHGTDLAAHSQTDNQKTAFSGALNALISIDGVNYLGPRLAAGREWSNTRGADQTNWIEHRAWLRADTSVYFVYTTLALEITVGSGGNRRVIHDKGAVELIVDREGALALGIPLEVLKSVVPVGKRAKAFPGEDGPGGLTPSPAAPPATSSDEGLREMMRAYQATIAALGNVNRPGPRPLPSSPEPATLPAEPATPPVTPATRARPSRTRRAADRFRARFMPAGNPPKIIELEEGLVRPAQPNQQDEPTLAPAPVPVPPVSVSVDLPAGLGRDPLRADPGAAGLAPYVALAPLTGQVFTVEVANERWQPLAEAFEFEIDASGTRRMTRRADSGVRTTVAHRLEATSQVWRLTTRVHLDGGSESDRAQLRDAARRGVRKHLHTPAYVLPGVGVRFEADVQFVDDPNDAHLSVEVANGGLMHQRRWVAGAGPAAVAHELAHNFGAAHREREADALLKRLVSVPVPRSGWQTDRPDGPEGFLSQLELQQIVEATLPYLGRLPTPGGPPPTDPAAVTDVEALRIWLDADGWEASEAYFEQHASLLTGGKANEVLQHMVVENPADDRLAAHGSLLELSRMDLGDVGYRYLTEPDAYRRREALLSPLASTGVEHLVAMVRTLTDLSRGAASLHSEQADVAVLLALGSILSGVQVDSPTAVGDHVRYLSPAARVGWLALLAPVAKGLPEHAPALRELGISLLTC